MNKGVKYPLFRTYQLTDDQDLVVKRYAELLSKQHGRRVSENAVVRQMIEHADTCHFFLTDISINKPISTKE